MRHRVAGKKLNRSSKHRKALFKNLAGQLFIHGEITTTEAKAKAIQSKVEKLITKAKEQTLHSRRQIHSVFNSKPVTNRLFDQIAPKLGQRESGFTRIRKVGVRRGDNANMVKLSLVDRAALIEVPEADVKKATPKTEATTK